MVALYCRSIVCLLTIVLAVALLIGCRPCHCLMRMPWSVFSVCVAIRKLDLDPGVLPCCLFMGDTCGGCLSKHCLPQTGLPEGCGVEAAARERGEDTTSLQAQGREGCPRTTSKCPSSQGQDIRLQS